MAKWGRTRWPMTFEGYRPEAAAHTSWPAQSSFLTRRRITRSLSTSRKCWSCRGESTMYHLMTHCFRFLLSV